MNSPSRTTTTMPAIYKLGFRLYRLLQLLVVIALIIGGIWGWRIIKDPNQFPIKVVKVQADYQHLDHNTIAQTLLPYVNRGFFNLSTGDLKKELLQFPWVATVDIHRVWPDTIIVKITEQHAAAQWGQQGLINTQGQLFKPPSNTFPKNLPVINSSENQVTTLLQYYQTMRTILAPLKLTISQIDADARQALDLQLTNGTKIFLGRSDPIPRLQRFAKIYHELFTTPAARAISIDLRYDNGIAIKWQPLEPQVTAAGA